MRKTQRFALLLLVILLGVIFAPRVQASGGIGLAPTIIELKDALRGGEYTYTLVIINPGSRETYYTLGTEEGEGADWVRYYADAESTDPIDGVAVPPESRLPVVVRFYIPSDAANRTYNVQLLVRAGLGPPMVEGARAGREPVGGAAVMVRAISDVTIDVTGTQILRAEVTGIMVENTELTYPLRTTVHLRNTGNVDARPEIRVEAWSEGQLIREFSFSEQVVKPGAEAVILSEGDTTGLEDGEYLIKVSVVLGGEQIGSHERDVQIYPVGTLTREGKLVALETEGEPYVGRVLKIMGTFANTGQIETTAQLNVEVYRDASLVGVEESRALRVLPKQSEIINAYYEIQEPGDYLFRAQVHFDGKLTDVSELALQVTLAPSQQEPLPASDQRAGFRGILDVPSLIAQGDRRALYFGGGVGLLMVALVYAGLSALNQRRKRDHSEA